MSTLLPITLVTFIVLLTAYLLLTLIRRQPPELIVAGVLLLASWSIVSGIHLIGKVVVEHLHQNCLQDVVTLLFGALAIIWIGMTTILRQFARLTKIHT